MWKFYFNLIFFLYCIDFIHGGCVLNMKDDLTKNHPLLLKENSPSWIELGQSSKGSIEIPRDEIIRLACTAENQKNSFKSPDLLNKNFVYAKCKDGRNFEVNKKSYKFEDLLCSSPVQYSEKSTGQQCLGANTELIKVGFQVENDFISVYTVCFDKTEKNTLYTDVTIPKGVDKSTVSVNDHAWLFSQNLYGSVNINSAYESTNQASTFKKILNKDYFDNQNRCYLEKGKLVTNSDLAFGPQQATTTDYLNVVPQWSTCNRKNWIEIENRVKNLAKSLNKPLQVYTGTYRKMSLSKKWGFSYEDMYLHYNSKQDKAIPVPLYIWKVVYEPSSQKAVAIIQINNPHLNMNDIDSLILCDDICKNVNWLNFLERKTIVDGYTYCCDLNNFEFGFAFKTSPFPKARGGILRDDNYRSG